jgi:putative peptide zinc metalloprotease protein
MASILPRLAVILALVTGTGWAAAGAPSPATVWHEAAPPAPAAPAASAAEETPAPSVTDEIPFIEDGRHVNTVEAQNRRDGRFELQGRADYVREQHDDVTAGNQAYAHATCTDCQTIALALQVVVYQQGATNVAPRNFAIAINEQCTRCLTVALAVQYAIPAEDPKALAPEIKDLVKELNKEMNELERIRQLNDGNVAQVEAQVNDIIARFDTLRAYLHEDRREAAPSEPAATPTAESATPVPATATPSPTATLTTSTSPASTATPSPPAAALGPSPTSTPSVAAPAPATATATSIPATATPTVIATKTP